MVGHAAGWLLVDGIAVIGAIRGHGSDAALCLPEQTCRLGRVVRIARREDGCGDLAGVGVHGKVKSASLPTGPLMFLRVPLAHASGFLDHAFGLNRRGAE